MDTEKACEIIRVSVSTKKARQRRARKMIDTLQLTNG